MLLGNYSVLNKIPGRFFAGRSVSDTRPQQRNSGAVRGRFYGEASVTNETDRNSMPVGYRPPYSFILSPKTGGLSSYSLVNGDGELTFGNLAGGLNAEADLAGVGLITNADLALIVSAVATISGSGTFSADIVGKLEASASLAGSGDLDGALGALADAVANIIGTGSVSNADMRAIAGVSADITPYTELSPESLAAAVWNAVAALYNGSGTMGEKLNDAGSASNPWADTSDYPAGSKGALLQQAADDAELASIK